MPEEKKPKSTTTADKSAANVSEEAGKKPDATENLIDAGFTKRTAKSPTPVGNAKKSDVPTKSAESQPSVSTEQKKFTEKPTAADAAEKPDAPPQPKDTKAKKADSEPKAAGSKQTPTALVVDLAKASDPDKPVADTKAVSAAVQEQADGKSAEEKSSEQKPTVQAPKKGNILSKAADPQKKPETKVGAAGLGLQITQIFADRLDYPDEKAQKSLPIPKEGEGFSMRLHPAYFHEFLDHPFSINREVKDYKDLFESIRDNGISEPVLARPGKDGGLELISGHRRHDIARQLNYPIPVVIRQIDDDTAQIGVVDGNLHRQDIPTSELARAAKMKMDALARKAGRRSKLEQLTAPQKRTDEIVGQDMGMSRNQVQRLVRIDALVPELKQQVDDKKLPFNTAVELSYLKPEEQRNVVDFMAKEQVTPSMAQATQLKEASRSAAALEKHAPSIAAAHKIDEKKVSEIVKPRKEPELKVTLTAAELKAYFPSPLPGAPKVKETIFEALTMRNKALAKQASKEAAKKAIKPVR